MTLDPELSVFLLSLVIGFSVGLLSGTMGVGGGIIMVPAAVLILGYGQHIGQGISLVVMIPTTLAGAFTHYRMKNLKLKPVFLIAIGAVTAGIIAAVIAQQLSQATLQRVFSLWVLYSAIRGWGINDWVMQRFFGKEPVAHEEEAPEEEPLT
ncbi:MAG: sulfite exporter TauE/SafE family protein [Chloroflexota bacterium]|nr:sulfite exporter TauE/SafE family protein [Chloroflexota bacterium]MDE2930012.1 sulfite exporter TauE/SafE family protein [Chloroflexota bacterium]